MTTNGELNARTVIVTVPTGVLAAGSFGFAPQLSAARREAIAQLPMALYNKVALSFSRKLIDAPAGRSVSGLTRKGQAFDAIVRPYNRDAAVVFVGGAHARELEEQGGGAAASFALSAMAEIYGDELRGADRALPRHALGQGSVRPRLVVDGHARPRRKPAWWWPSRTTTACSSPARRPIRYGRRASAAPMPRACAPRARRWRCWGPNVRRWDGVAGMSNRWTSVSFLRNGATQTR